MLFSVPDDSLDERTVAKLQDEDMDGYHQNLLHLTQDEKTTNKGICRKKFFKKRTTCKFHGTYRLESGSCIAQSFTIELFAFYLSLCVREVTLGEVPNMAFFFWEGERCLRILVPKMVHNLAPDRVLIEEKNNTNVFTVVQSTQLRHCRRSCLQHADSPPERSKRTPREVRK